MEISIYDAFVINKVIDKLIEQNANLTVRLSYNLYKIKKKLDEIESYAMERMEMVFGEDFNSEDFTQDEKNVYEMILSSKIEEEIPLIKTEELLDNDKINLSITDIEKLSAILN